MSHASTLITLTQPLSITPHPTDTMQTLKPQCEQEPHSSPHPPQAPTRPHTPMQATINPIQPPHTPMQATSSPIRIPLTPHVLMHAPTPPYTPMHAPTHPNASTHLTTRQGRRAGQHQRHKRWGLRPEPRARQPGWGRCRGCCTRAGCEGHLRLRSRLQNGYRAGMRPIGAIGERQRHWQVVTRGASPSSKNFANGAACVQFKPVRLDLNMTNFHLLTLLGVGHGVGCRCVGGVGRRRLRGVATLLQGGGREKGNRATFSTQVHLRPQTQS